MRRIVLQLALLIPIIVFGFFLFKENEPSASKQSPAPESRNSNMVRENEVTPEFSLKGEGRNIEAPEFFEAEKPTDTLLFVSGKKSDSLEIWSFPFQNTEEKIFERETSPNGLLIDQEEDLLFIADLDRNSIESFTLPDLVPKMIIGKDILKPGEHNLGLLILPGGKKRLYTTDDNGILGFDFKSGKLETRFSPEVDAIEEVVADSFHQIIYVPDESGIRSQKNKDGVILAFHPDGKPYQKNGSNRVGEGLYSGDAEGIELYRCLNTAREDTGKGFLLSVDQNRNENNGIEIFDRESWEHRGTLHLDGVRETDGIDIHERALPGYPQGLLAASDNDTSIAIVSWEKVAAAMELHCE